MSDIHDVRKLPAHVAVIMDGNGRWAHTRRWERVTGHEAGARAVRKVTRTCAETERISHLTLFAFSSENWQRPRLEVNALMALLGRYLDSERAMILDENIRFTCIGRWRELPDGSVRKIERLMDESAANTGMTLCLALNYGGRTELTDAVRGVAADVAAGRLDADAIDEATIGEHLYQPEFPDPDLLIRTAGENRISNFMLWQLSYAEFYVSPVLWPDFDERELRDAFAAYATRVRRFGRVVGTEADASAKRA